MWSLGRVDNETKPVTALLVVSFLLLDQGIIACTDNLAGQLGHSLGRGAAHEILKVDLWRS